MPIFGDRWIEFWRARSLRFWLVLCSSLALFPLLGAAAIGYFLHDATVEGPLREIFREEHLVRAPLQRLPSQLWEAIMPLTNYAAAGEQRHADRFRQEVAEANQAFESLMRAAEPYPATTKALLDAREWWSAAATRGNIFIESPPESRPVDDLEKIETMIDRAGQILTQLHEVVAEDIERRQDEVQNSTLHEEVIAFVFSVAFMLLSLTAIDRSLGGSINQLVEGATRLAAGDRSYVVNVTLPPELRKVATAFNLMTTRIAEQEKALSEAARTDGLTGLFNRREFDRALSEELRRSQRSGEPFSLVMIDIDHFKKFNDTYGHQGGDAALKAVAETVRATLRDIDKAFRYGGEEMAILLPNSDAQAALQAAERLRDRIAHHVVDLGDGRQASVTGSMGVSAAGPQNRTAEQLIAEADARLYRSKAEGRNRVTAT
jgi:diguanylate cyclase (GGDEF)-like protein